MAYNFDELNAVEIFNIHEKLRDDNTTIEFCQTYGLLRHTPYCPLHETEYNLNKRHNTYS